MDLIWGGHFLHFSKSCFVLLQFLPSTTMLHYSKQLHIKHKDQVVTEAEACFPQFRLLTSSAIGSAMSSVIGHLNQQLD